MSHLNLRRRSVIIGAMYDVAIIGSGYGGAVIAARLAGRARVLLVERGRR
ncbi:MAG: hypothetical protein IPL79_02030 [Myxococcales bacterium]|nr:hypothetical protein [Myxococcales bacterium]